MWKTRPASRMCDGDSAIPRMSSISSTGSSSSNSPHRLRGKWWSTWDVHESAEGRADGRWAREGAGRAGENGDVDLCPGGLEYK